MVSTLGSTSVNTEADPELARKAREEVGESPLWPWYGRIPDPTPVVDRYKIQRTAIFYVVDAEGKIQGKNELLGYLLPLAKTLVAETEAKAGGR